MGRPPGHERARSRPPRQEEQAHNRQHRPSHTRAMDTYEQPTASKLTCSAYESCWSTISHQPLQSIRQTIDDRRLSACLSLPECLEVTSSMSSASSTSSQRFTLRGSMLERHRRLEHLSQLFTMN